MTAEDLPAFERPPVQEVALAVHFVPLAGLRSQHYGDLARVWRDEYPQVEDQPALLERPSFQQPDPPPGIQFVNVDPLPRCWFISKADDLLIQVQRDRLVHNWRQRELHYPHYEKLLPKFTQAWTSFSAFVDDEGLGKVRPTEVEVSYFNAVKPPEDSVVLAEVLQPLTGGFNDSTLPPPTSGTLTLEFPMLRDRDPIGRLEVRAVPAEGPSGRVVLLNLTARGRPLSDGLEGITEFMNLGHELIVRGFASMTTSRMHQEWGRFK